MSFLSRFFSNATDPREEVRKLWHRAVEIAREPEWYASCDVADNLEGRFDMVSAVLALVLIRMEQDPQLAQRTGPLTEFFVEDMDGQLRQSGVGDLMVGKKIGKLMSTLGGRIGAYRTALLSGQDALAEVAERNVELQSDTSGKRVALRLKELEKRLKQTSAEALLAGEIA